MKREKREHLLLITIFGKAKGIFPKKLYELATYLIAELHEAVDRPRSSDAYEYDMKK